MHSASRDSADRTSPPSKRKPPCTRRTTSWRKYRQTATRVPKCTATSNTRPWSFHSMTFGTSTRWPELEIGSISVSPCTTARTTMWIQLKRAFRPCSSCSQGVRPVRRGERRGRGDGAAGQANAFHVLAHLAGQHEYFRLARELEPCRSRH